MLQREVNGKYLRCRLVAVNDNKLFCASEYFLKSILSKKKKLNIQHRFDNFAAKKVRHVVKQFCIKRPAVRSSTEMGNLKGEEKASPAAIRTSLIIGDNKEML